MKLVSLHNIWFDFSYRTSQGQKLTKNIDLVDTQSHLFSEKQALFSKNEHLFLQHHNVYSSHNVTNSSNIQVQHLGKNSTIV